jgi:hypothetical protein
MMLMLLKASKQHALTPLLAIRSMTELSVPPVGHPVIYVSEVIQGMLG